MPAPFQANFLIGLTTSSKFSASAHGIEMLARFKRVFMETIEQELTLPNSEMPVGAVNQDSPADSPATEEQEKILAFITSKLAERRVGNAELGIESVPVAMACVWNGERWVTHRSFGLTKAGNPWLCTDVVAAYETKYGAIPEADRLALSKLQVCVSFYYLINLVE